MRLILFVILATMAATPAVAQGPTAVGLRNAPIHAPSPHSRNMALDSIPQTHWDLGFGIGAGFGFLAGLGLQALFDGLCEGSGCRGFHPLAFLMPMALLGIIGGLIGSAFPK